MLKYEEIIDKLLSDPIYVDGDRLPPIRALAEQMNCSRGTVIRAYEILEERHLAYTIPQSGTYLMKRQMTGAKSQNRIDFVSAGLESRLRPHKHFEHCMIQALQSEHYDYAPPEGLESLRKCLVSHFEKRYLYTSVDRILVTTGAQQALYLVLQLILESKQGLMIEQPTYGDFQRIIEKTNVSVYTFNREGNSIDFNALEITLKQNKIGWLYTVSNFQNPLGTSLSSKAKKKLLELANQYNFYVIEDDYLGDLNLDLKVETLHYLDIENRVFYVTSFSKTFLPGIRIGTLIAPETYVEMLKFYKKSIDLNTCTLSQMGLQKYFDAEIYDKHIRKVKRAIRGKMKFLRRYQKLFIEKGIECEIPDAGIFAWLVFPENIDVLRLVKILKAERIDVIHGNFFYWHQRRESHAIRISIANVNEASMTQGIERIIEVIEHIK
ncbi:aminotransferase-like domain-containing protein [Fusibacter ferrireducens]|uniref:PLP-dependent aminotransferase family protein n=1 Tax=Fusibacter ferrireducens TaxID=2785058 RepID=A0ABR9ZQF1_9FIRM|nr:PLP-dependent aminotransferase family protein [Fusibacter ferrireducens]MBF4692692.1 PLP-dependent aminotransferase family protein [Fusibacter ferrireducens]